MIFLNLLLSEPAGLYTQLPIRFTCVPDCPHLFLLVLPYLASGESFRPCQIIGLSKFILLLFIKTLVLTSKCTSAPGSFIYPVATPDRTIRHWRPVLPVFACGSTVLLCHVWDNGNLKAISLPGRRKKLAWCGQLLPAPLPALNTAFSLVPISASLSADVRGQTTLSGILWSRLCWVAAVALPFPWILPHFVLQLLPAPSIPLWFLLRLQPNRPG